MAAPPTPLPRRARAVVVGIESYELPDAAAPGPDSTTHIPDLEGVVDDALRLAASLQADLGLAADDIDLWLSPGAARGAADGARVHAFTRDGFENFLTATLAGDAQGGLLLLCWIGHGVIDERNRLRLLLPGSSTLKPRDFDAEDICTTLVGNDLAQFSHQMLVVQACRVTTVSAGIGGRLNNTQIPAQPPDAARPVVQLKVFGCSLAESSRQPRDGAPLLRALRDGWKGAQRDPWPDFEDVALAAAGRVDSDTNGEQRPQVVGWTGKELMAPPKTLRTLLGAAGWTTETFRALALRCLRAKDRREPMTSLTAIVDALDDLVRDGDVRPLNEFVARVLEKLGKEGVAAPKELQSWFDRRTDGNERTEIDKRLQADAPLHVLQLWVQDQPPGVSAALLDGDGRALFTDWDIHAVRAFDPADAASLLAALGGWLEDAIVRAGQPLLLEMFLPTARLAAGIDGCTVAAGGDDYALGVELPTFLRSTDRHKSRKKRDVWLLKAPKILARYVSARLLLHWSAEPADADLIRAEFAETHADGAVWLGLPAPPAAPVTGRTPCAFDHALDSGVPSMLWLRGGLGAPTREQLEDALRMLLADTAQNLPRTLRAWRERHAAVLRGEPALLLDDPARPPPWAQAFGRPGGG